MVAAVVPQDPLGPVLALLGAVRRPPRNIINPVEDAAAAAPEVAPRVGRRVSSLMSSRLLDESGGLALENLPSHKWREPWYVTFANESALDAGGPSREFFRLVSKDLASSGLFSIAPVSYTHLTLPTKA